MNGVIAPEDNILKEGWPLFRAAAGVGCCWGETELLLQNSVHMFSFFSPAGLCQDGCSASVSFLINATLQPSARKSQLLQLEAERVHLLSLRGCEPASLQLLSTTARVKLNGDI